MKLNRKHLRKMILQEFRRLNEDPIGDAQADINKDMIAIAKEVLVDEYEASKVGRNTRIYNKTVLGPENDINEYKLTLKIEYID